MIDPLENVDDIFRLLGGPAKVGQAVGKPTEHAAAWRRRGRIPSDHWPALVEYAKGRGFTNITYETVTRVHAGLPAEPAEAEESVS